MKILFLGYEKSSVLDFLRTQGDVTSVSPMGEIPTGACDCLVSYGYRRIVPHTVLEQYPHSAVNLHISLLPWNKGADPNFWSWWDNTKKGVSIIGMTDKLDEGDIYAQKEVAFSDEETLTSSYWKLRTEIERLFIESWPTLWTIPPQKQVGTGSNHRVSDLDTLKERLKAASGVEIDWDTPVSSFHKLHEYDTKNRS